MIYSMTAFSRQQLEQEWGSLTWEIRSVNHRYLEPNIRMPEQFRSLEPVIREAIRKQVNRGKIECQLRFQADQNRLRQIQLNPESLQQLKAASIAIRKTLPDTRSLSNAEILAWPGVIKEQEMDTDSLEKHAVTLFRQTLAELLAARAREGEELGQLIQQRLEAVNTIIAEVRELLPDILKRQRDNLQSRLSELKAELEPGRLEQEIVLLAQKCDVDEELDRLDSHIGEVTRVLGAAGQKGRRLDFLMQELNREANTLSSKSVVAQTTRSAVELKVLIEQMREQIQNIE